MSKSAAHVLPSTLIRRWPTEALEDALYDSQALRHFVGIDLSTKSVPGATTPLKFRDNDLAQALFDAINAHSKAC